MPTVRDYNRKLFQLRNTRKMTKTMKMVAASKLRKMQEAMAHLKDFCDKYYRDFAAVLGESDLLAHPFFTGRKHSGQALLLMITTDRGLCGGFNNNLNRKTLAWLSENSEKYGKIEVSFCGRRGFRYFKRRTTVAKNYDDILSKLSFRTAAGIASEISSAFLAGQYDEIFVARNKFKTVMSQEPVLERLLPMNAAAFCGGTGTKTTEVKVEPSCDSLAEFLLLKVLTLRLYSCFIESAVGENGARMTAMDMATTNAEKIIGNVTLLRNRARQAAITRELIEIIGGAEALA